MKRVNPQRFDIRSHDLLLLLGEELKQPLVAIKQLSEINSATTTDVQAYAQQALRTIDNILLYQKVHSGQTNLLLEPVHVGSAIQEVAHLMNSSMKMAGCSTELKIQHGLSPVDVDRKLLSSGLQSLWQAFLGTVNQPSHIVCQAKRTPQGIRISLHSNGAELDDLKLARPNTVSAQPITGFGGPATDLLTAKGIFELLGAELKKSSCVTQAGLGATFRVSKQLQMI